jgi:hypothetical protein
VTDGTLHLIFIPKVNSYAYISAIEVKSIQVIPTVTFTPTYTASPTATSINCLSCTTQRNCFAYTESFDFENSANRLGSSRTGISMWEVPDTNNPGTITYAQNIDNNAGTAAGGFDNPSGTVGLGVCPCMIRQKDLYLEWKQYINVPEITNTNPVIVAQLGSRNSNTAGFGLYLLPDTNGTKLNLSYNTYQNGIVDISTADFSQAGWYRIELTWHDAYGAGRSGGGPVTLKIHKYSYLTGSDDGSYNSVVSGPGIDIGDINPNASVLIGRSSAGYLHGYIDDLNVWNCENTGLYSTYTATSTVTGTFTATPTNTRTSTATPTFTNTPQSLPINLSWPQAGYDSENTNQTLLAGHDNTSNERYRFPALGQINNLTCDDSNNVYFSCASNGVYMNNIYKVDDNGSAVFVNAANYVLSSITLGLYNHMYYLDTMISGDVETQSLQALKIDDGSTTWTLGTPQYDWTMDFGYFNTRTLRLDNSGSIYMDLMGWKKVIDGVTSYTNSWSTKIVGGGYCWTLSPDVSVVDSSGNIFITDPISSICPNTQAGLQIEKYDSNGDLLSTIQLGMDYNPLAKILLDDVNGYVYVQACNVDSGKVVYFVLDRNLSVILNTIDTGYVYSGSNEYPPVGAIYKPTGELYYVGTLIKDYIKYLGSSDYYFANRPANNLQAIFSYKYNGTQSGLISLKYFTDYPNIANIADITSDLVFDSYGKLYFATSKAFYIIKKDSMTPCSVHVEDGTKLHIAIGQNNRVYYYGGLVCQDTFPNDLRWIL